MNKKLPTLGILGGMGPVVTVEFFKSIYEYNQFIDNEQEAPNVIVFHFLLHLIAQVQLIVEMKQNSLILCNCIWKTSINLLIV